MSNKIKTRNQEMTRNVIVTDFMIDLYSLLSLYASVVSTVFSSVSEGKTKFLGVDGASASSNTFTTFNSLYLRISISLAFVQLS